ncbi:MAG: hypothetical protein HUU20_13520, partial [Pirellulales bacterium]|nr:hypothetical protein [Pirellulales bacterium]
PLARADWTAEPGWLANPAATEQASVARGDPTTVFRVSQAGRGMKWLWTLPEPVALDTRRYVSLRYRANGLSARGEYALAAIGKPGGDAPGYTALIDSPELISDGRWHVVNVDLREASAVVPAASGLALQVQADQPDASLELAEIRIADTMQFSLLADAFDLETGASWQGFHSVGLDGLADRRSAAWLRHLRISGWFDGPEATVQGVPLAVLRNEQDLAATGIREKGELRVPVGGKACEIYLVLLAALVGDEEPAYGPGRFTAIRDVDRFRLRVEYSDGSVDECLPMNAATGRFGVASGAQILVAAADPARPIASLVLCDLAKQAGFALAAVTLRTDGPRRFPEILEEQSFVELKPPRRAGDVVLEMEMAAEGPPLLKGLLDRVTGWNLLPQPCAIVQVTVDGEPVPIGDWQRANADADWRWYQARSAEGIRLGLRTAADGPDSVRISACVRNSGDRDRRIRLVAPSIGPYRLGEEPGNGFYLYPKRGAALDVRPCSYRELYSGLFPVQFLDTFSPADGRGLALRTEDTSCIRRYYLLEKSGDGFTAGVEYPEQELKPGETLISAPSVVTLTDGDWRRGLDAYRAWVKTWHQPISPRNPWFREVFNFRQRFLWWLDPLYDQEKGRIDLNRAIDEARREFGGIDYLHLFDWGNCGQYGRIYGRTGDYSPYDYLEGGCQALREAIARVQAEGIPVGLYIEGYLLQQRGRLGQDSGAKWQLIGRDGKGLWWPESTEMFVCAAVEAWREIQASTYESKVPELGVDGMYIDQFGFSHNKDCWSDRHGHEAPSYGVTAERDTTTRIRERIEGVKKNVALYTEEMPVDVTTQYQDGSFTYALSTSQRTLTQAPLNLARFAVPDFKTIEILYCDKPTGSWATGVKWVFFNGEAIWLEGPADEWFEPETRQAVRRCYGILRKHRDAFTTLRPMPLAPTLAAGVFANAFPIDGKTVYTLYNARHRTVRGEVLRIPAAESSAIHDEWHAKPAQVRRDGTEAVVTLEIGPHDVGCIAVEQR